MRNLLMKVSYDGTDYNGFQTQPGGHTIQDYLEEAIHRLSESGSRLRLPAGQMPGCMRVPRYLISTRLPHSRRALVHGFKHLVAGRYRGFGCDGGTDGIPFPPCGETQNLSFYHQCESISGSIQPAVPDPSSWKTGYRGDGAGTFSSDRNARLYDVCVTKVDEAVPCSYDF